MPSNCIIVPYCTFHWCILYTHFPPPREWTSQQMTEKARLSHEEKEAERLYSLKARELDQRAVELSRAEVETRRAINLATKDYNLALVCVCVCVCMWRECVTLFTLVFVFFAHAAPDQTKEKAAQQQQELTQEQDDNYTEVCNHIHGDVLTGEAVDSCRNSLYSVLKCCHSQSVTSYMTSSTHTHTHTQRTRMCPRVPLVHTV